MPAILGILAGLAGAGLSFMGASDSASAMKQDEAIRQQAMNLDAQRRQRQLIREGNITRANATSNAVSQGAQFGTGLAGGLAQATGEQTYGLYNSRTEQALGNRLFASNMNMINAKSMMATGSGLSSLGGGLVKDSGQISSLTNYAFS